MNWLTSLFSSDKIVDNAVTALDKVVFTEQEKSAFLIKAMQATLPMAVSRRILAFGITSVWAFLIVLWAGLTVAGMDTTADKIYTGIRDLVTNPFNIIVGFYFLKAITDRIKK